MTGPEGIDAVVADANRFDKSEVVGVGESVPVGFVGPGVGEVNLVEVNWLSSGKCHFVIFFE